MGLAYLVVSTPEVETRIVVICAFGVPVYYFPAVAVRHFQMVLFAGSDVSRSDQCQEEPAYYFLMCYNNLKEKLIIF